MNIYKKFIPFKARFFLLRMLKFIPDKTMLGLQYKIKLHRRLNLKDPQRYTEKIQWYKLYYRDEKMPVCADKYTVRDYVASKGLSDILVKQYVCWNDIDDIDFKDLPNQFVLKLTTGSNTNMIIRDKTQQDVNSVKSRFAAFKKQANTSAGREWMYREHVPRIIAEELLKDNTSPDGAIADYKFLCFSGKPEFVVLDVNRFTDHRRNIYDTQWNDLQIASDCPCADGDFPKPAQLDKMLEIAAVLSEDFPAVRVDLYCVNDKIYFGELTFFPWSGYVQFSPDSFDRTMGDLFVLPADKAKRT